MTVFFYLCLSSLILQPRKEVNIKDLLTDQKNTFVFETFSRIYLGHLFLQDIVKVTRGVVFIITLWQNNL